MWQQTKCVFVSNLHVTHAAISSHHCMASPICMGPFGCRWHYASRRRSVEIWPILSKTKEIRSTSIRLSSNVSPQQLVPSLVMHLSFPFSFRVIVHFFNQALTISLHKSSYTTRKLCVVFQRLNCWRRMVIPCPSLSQSALCGCYQVNLSAGCSL